jgi:hypothetical protein
MSNLLFNDNGSPEGNTINIIGENRINEARLVHVSKLNFGLLYAN